MKSSTNGLSSSLIIRGLESSMHANAKIPDVPEAPKKRRGSCMSGRALGKPRDAGDRGGLEACAGKCVAKARAGNVRSAKLAEMRSKALC